MYIYLILFYNCLYVIMVCFLVKLYLLQLIITTVKLLSLPSFPSRPGIPEGSHGEARVRCRADPNIAGAVKGGSICLDVQASGGDGDM